MRHKTFVSIRYSHNEKIVKSRKSFILCLNKNFGQNCPFMKLILIDIKMFVSLVYIYESSHEQFIPLNNVPTCRKCIAIRARSQFLHISVSAFHVNTLISRFNKV